MTHYELLDVPMNADEQAIKRAWARLVRLHPPDKDPEMNQRLNEAKSTLLDATARSDYDAQLQFGAEIDELFEAGLQCMEEEDHRGAIRFYKEILALHPKSFSARNLLALAYAYDDQFAEAVRQYERLTSEAPNSALYAANFGHVLRRRSAQDPSKLHEAERWYRRAIELESFNTEHHLSLARLLVSETRYPEAEEAIEGAVAADGKTDIGDIEALMELTWVYLLSKRQDKVATVAERIAAVLPDEPEARLYASYKFLQTAAELIDDYRAYQDAEVFIKAARRIESDFGDARESVERMELHAKADREADRMKDDSSIQPRVVPTLLAYTVHCRLGFEFEDGYGTHLIDAASTWSQAELRSALNVCRSRYPNACQVISDVTPTLIQLGHSGYAPARQNVPTNTSSGCLLPLAFLALTALVGGCMLR